MFIINREFYINYLLNNLPKAKLVAGGEEIQCRCRYCPDSKNPNHGHFYISIPRNNEEISLFQCKKCQASGIVTDAKLLEWQIYEPEVAMDLIMHNKAYYNNPKARKKIGNNKVFNIRYYNINDDDLSRYKLKRINDRLGLSLTYEDCIRHKIVLNISDILQSNKLDLTRHPNIIESLDNGFIGFMSSDNSNINMRNLDIIKNIYKGIDKRYINYKLFNDIDTSNKFYSCSDKIDISKVVEIHIAEGPFDILSVRYNVLDNNVSNKLLLSIGGNRYVGLLKHLITSYGIILFDIHIYMDNDQDIDKISYSLINTFEAFKCGIYIHRNTYHNEKDHGVTKDKIIDTVIKIR